jgi:hypothetical protein
MGKEDAFTTQVHSVAELLRYEALAVFAMTVDEHFVLLSEDRSRVLADWEEKHGIDEFKVKAIAFLKR